MIGNPLLVTGGEYQISRSVRLRSSATASFSRTPGSAGNRKTWTWSGWVKRGVLGTNSTLFSAGADVNNRLIFNFANEDTLVVQNVVAGTTTFNRVTTPVYSDPSAWYHCVLAVDTTQATASNRLKLYVNGAQVTAFSTSNDFSLNYDGPVNQATGHRIGLAVGGVSYFDGYLTDINFIDGQALTPASFGETDAITGVWKPKKYTGTYGTNGFYLNFSDPSAATAEAIGRDYSRGTNLFTYSEELNNAAWAKQQVTISADATTAPDGTTTADKVVENSATAVHLVSNTAPVTSGVVYTLSAYVKASGRSTCMLRFSGANSAFAFSQASFDLSNGTLTASSCDSASITDEGDGWYRVTATETATATATATLSVGLGTGSYTGDGTSGLFVWGAQAEPGSAASTYTQTVGSTAPNNWTPSGVSVTAGATYDSMLDVPTLWADGGNGRGNYAVMNPLATTASTGVITGGNLNVTTQNTGGGNAYGTIAIPTSGKWYWEVTPTAGMGTASGMIGIAAYSASDSYAYNNSASLGYYSFSGNKYVNTVSTAYGATYTDNDVIGIAVDADGGTVTFYKNNASQGAITYNAAGLFPFTCDANASLSASFVANFGQRPFAYTPPTGFKALHTGNLPEPSITKGSDWFDVKLATGANIKTTAEATFTGNELVWIKDRANVNNHQLVDSVRGTSAVLQSNTTAAETTYTAPTGNSVGWVWKEGATPGFDIVTYTGNGANRTVAHSLGVAPKMLIVKKRTGTIGSGSSDWLAWHTAIAASQVLYLNTTAAVSTNASALNSTAPTSTVFSLGTNTLTNENTGTFVAYLFSEVAGFSKFGSYTGNGSTDGPFVFCGFLPRFVMWKRTNGASSWIIVDTARNTSNVVSNYVLPNLSDAEASTPLIDATANGFKLRTTAAGTNAASDNIIFAAFAENPFKYALAR